MDLLVASNGYGRKVALYLNDGSASFEERVLSTAANGGWCVFAAFPPCR